MSSGKDRTLRCAQLCFGYGKTVVLRDFEHAFEPGITLLKGYSGCGKSTLLKLIAGFLRPAEGNVQLPGGWKYGSRDFQRRALGFVFQQLNLLPLATVRRNLSIVSALAGIAPSDAGQRIDHLLQRLGLDRMQHRRPGTLSGGQQQRAAIARALVKWPRVVLLDEPTSGLDDLNCKVICRLLQEELPNDCICLIATHDSRLDLIANESLDFNRFLPVEGHLASLA